MLSRTATGSNSQPKKNGLNTGVMPSYRGDLDSDICTSFFSLAPSIYIRVLLQGEKFNFLYEFTCHWTLKLPQFLYFIT